MVCFVNILSLWIYIKQDIHFKNSVLVGISPRITTYDAITGLARYKNWQYTWWNGIYNIVLTKAALLHKKYLYEYSKVIPKEFLTFIDENRNCEDLAMAYLVSIQVWVCFHLEICIMFCNALLFITISLKRLQCGPKLPSTILPVGASAVVGLILTLGNSILFCCYCESYT